MMAAKVQRPRIRAIARRTSTIASWKPHNGLPGWSIGAVARAELPLHGLDDVQERDALGGAREDHSASSTTEGQQQARPHEVIHRLGEVRAGPADGLPELAQGNGPVVRTGREVGKDTDGGLGGVVELHRVYVKPYPI
jgi:hypothetical protein